MPRPMERNPPQSAARTAWKKSEASDEWQVSNKASAGRHQASLKRESVSEPPEDRSIRSGSMASSTNAASHKDADRTRSKSAKALEDSSPGKKSEGSGFMSMLTGLLGVGDGSSQVNTSEQDHILRRAKTMERDHKNIQQDLDSNIRKINVMERKHAQEIDEIMQNAEYEVEESRRQLQSESNHLQRAMGSLHAELGRANEKISALKKRAAEDEAKINKAYTSAVSTLARDVSRDVPDDVVKNDISKFFQGDFLSWCADMGVNHITPQESIETDLRAAGIINGSQSYLQAPKHLKFDMDMPDGSSPLVLLQAALAKRLCQLFLSNPYFLAADRCGLKEFEAAFTEGQRKFAIDWRIQTVTCLEATVPLSSALYIEQAKAFETDYKFLLGEIDSEARDDLAQLFADFAILALKLWKIRTTISVFGMPGLADEAFHLGSDHVEGEPAVVSALGQQLNGRPIGVIVRPLIISEPVGADGKPQKQVIWSKALAWVSGKEGSPACAMGGM